MTTLHINQLSIEAPAGISIFDAAEKLGVQVPTSCRKNGKCRECIVEVSEGMERLTPRSAEEEHLNAGFRLSCRARFTGAAGEVRCETMRRGALKIVTAVEAAVAALEDLEPAVTRCGSEVLLDGRPIARGAGPLHGLAIDLGTTTVVLRLVDLESGAELASSAFENPQRFGGSDVMSRIQYDTEHPGRLLQRTLLGYLRRAIEELPGDPGTIYEVAVAGNPTQRDLFFGLPVRSIGQRPYRSIVEEEYRRGLRSSTSLSMPAGRLRLPVHPQARVYGLPLVSGHVGADAAAVLLAIDIAREERLVGLMDIGTNTELLVGNREHLFAASCPAGPAFEGGLIACGMPALEGAVEGVRLSEGAPALRVIGGGAPRGLCGSGLVECLGELLRLGRIDEFGRFRDGSDRVALQDGGGLYLSEADISHLAQAKGAHAAGLRIVLKQAGVTFEALELFYLAGGFGRHLQLDAARIIGLIPDLPETRLVQIGNAAIEGATIALLSRRRRLEIEALIARAEHVELETDPEFFDHFVEGCLFKPLRSVAV